MQQYTIEITPELRESSSQSPYYEDFLESWDSKTREEFEDFNKHVSRQITYIFRFAVVGSVTRDGGMLCNVSGGGTAGSYRIARVGDKVVYADGSEATVISGAGEARIMQGASATLVGSILDNGDEIISTPQSVSRLIFPEGDTFPKGLLTMPGSEH